MWREFKGAAYAAYRAGSPKLAAMAKEDFVTQYEAEYPSATACFLDDFEACVSYLQLPMAHRASRARPTYWSGCFWKSVGAPRRFRMHSVSVRY